jgi:hypothetical protein
MSLCLELVRWKKSLGFVSGSQRRVHKDGAILGNAAGPLLLACHILEGFSSSPFDIAGSRSGSTGLGLTPYGEEPAYDSFQGSGQLLLHALVCLVAHWYSASSASGANVSGVRSFPSILGTGHV